MKDALIVSLLSLTPRKRGARAMGRIARSPASRLMTRWFIRTYRVDMSEAEKKSYPSLEALFTRRLREGARPIDSTEHALVSPVDGRVAFVGWTKNGLINVSEHRTLNIHDLLGFTSEEEYQVAILYLSPKDYHRVHVPETSRVTEYRYLPGTLWPVFPAAVRKVRGLFQRNERVVVTLDTPHGTLYSVLVGAFGVGRITLSFADLITNSGTAGTHYEFKEPKTLQRGEELGIFHLGSTVILASSSKSLDFCILKDQPIKMGQKIGQYL